MFRRVCLFVYFWENDCEWEVQHTCCWVIDGFVSKCWRWCSIRWFFWKNALPHSQTWVRTVQPPFGWRRLCCMRPCLAAKPLPQLAQKCDFGLVGAGWFGWCCCCCCGCCWGWPAGLPFCKCCCDACCCCCCCWWWGCTGIEATKPCGWVVAAACTNVVCDTTWPVDDMIWTGIWFWAMILGLEDTTAVEPGFMPLVLKRCVGKAAVKAHKSVIRLLSPVCKRRWRAKASRLLKALPHSLRK